jgi:hypothetical protein
MQFMKASAILISVLAVAAFVGCEKQPTTTSTNTPSAKTDTQAHDDGTVHTDAPSAAGHHGKPIELGTATASEFSLRAARDEGAITPGGDAPIDVWVTGGTTKVVGVRFWIGTEDAKGSIKAKAEIEFPAEPDHWHTHAEIPDPMPAGSRLWVEVEDDKGGRSLASFDLKA